jgi:hypothetical protein
MVHSNRTVVALLHKHFSSWLSTFCKSVSIIANCTYTTVSECYITAYVNNTFTFFSSQLITCNFPSVPIVFHQFFTWFARGDVYLWLSLVKKRQCRWKRELNEPCDYITNLVSPYTWLMAWQWYHCLLPRTEDKCGHGLSIPQCIKSKIAQKDI